jgi:hypothetical protein
MKYLLAVGVVFFFGVGVAQAQGTSVGSGASVGSGRSVGDGGSLNSQGSINPSGPAEHGATPVDPRSSKSVAGKNPGEYVPSTFQNYDDALAEGVIEGKRRPLTLAEIARLSQQKKAAETHKPALVLEKDVDGKLILVPAKQ